MSEPYETTKSPTIRDGGRVSGNEGKARGDGKEAASVSRRSPVVPPHGTMAEQEAATDPQRQPGAEAQQAALAMPAESQERLIEAARNEGRNEGRNEWAVPVSRDHLRVLADADTSVARWLGATERKLDELLAMDVALTDLGRNVGSAVAAERRASKAEGAKAALGFVSAVFSAVVSGKTALGLIVAGIKALRARGSGGTGVVAVGGGITSFLGAVGGVAKKVPSFTEAEGSFKRLAHQVEAVSRAVVELGRFGMDQSLMIIEDHLGRAKGAGQGLAAIVDRVTSPEALAEFESEVAALHEGFGRHEDALRTLKARLEASRKLGAGAMMPMSGMRSLVDAVTARHAADELRLGDVRMKLVYLNPKTLEPEAETATPHGQKMIVSREPMALESLPLKSPIEPVEAGWSGRIVSANEVAAIGGVLKEELMVREDMIEVRCGSYRREVEAAIWNDPVAREGWKRGIENWRVQTGPRARVDQPRRAVLR